MNRWVIGRRREEALEVAKNRFGGQNFELYQVVSLPLLFIIAGGLFVAKGDPKMAMVAG